MRKSDQSARTGQAELPVNILLDALPCLVVVADSSGRISYVSPAVQNILNYTPAELLQDGWWNLTIPDPQACQAAKERVARTARGELPRAALPSKRK